MFVKSLKQIYFIGKMEKLENKKGSKLYKYLPSKKLLEQARGIDNPSDAWQAPVLPLTYTYI